MDVTHYDARSTYITGDVASDAPELEGQDPFESSAASDKVAVTGNVSNGLGVCSSGLGTIFQTMCAEDLLSIIAFMVGMALLRLPRALSPLATRPPSIRGLSLLGGKSS